VYRNQLPSEKKRGKMRSVQESGIEERREKMERREEKKSGMS